jgi:hypothetical protein
LTRRLWKRVWRPAKVGMAKARPEVAGCDRSVRGYVVTSARGRKHRGRGIPPEGSSIAAPARTERYLVRTMHGVKPGHVVATRMDVESRSWRVAVKRCSTQVKLAAPAAGGRTKQAARLVEAKPGIERFAGCSCRESIADIGETHLLRSCGAGREARFVARSSLKRPPCLLTGPGLGSRQAKGCGAGACKCESERNPVYSGREVGVESMEGVLVRVLSSF